MTNYTREDLRDLAMNIIKKDIERFKKSHEEYEISAEYHSIAGKLRLIYFGLDLIDGEEFKALDDAIDKILEEKENENNH